MSRQIKFRVWDEIIHDWHATKAISEFTDRCTKGYNFNVVCFGNPKRTFIEQYTGLKDKNGKEIYEGDIVANGTLTGVVQYKVDDFCAWTVGATPNGVVLLSGSWYVIGNIHEPPKDFRPEHLKRMGISISKGGEE